MWMLIKTQKHLLHPKITMNFMTMTMAMQTNRAKRLIKMLQRLLKQEQLYTDEQLKTMKSQLKVIKEELAVAEAKNSKGFGK